MSAQDEGNRRGPSGYLCCKHCKEDQIHDVPTDGHDGPCSTCDDPGAMLRERAERAEAKVARVRSLIAHLHTEFVEGCFRCDLGRDEAQGSDDFNAVHTVIDRAMQTSAHPVIRAVDAAEAVLDWARTDDGRAVFKRAMGDA